MRPHTEQELEHYERLVAQLRTVVVRQQSRVYQSTDPGVLKITFSLLEQMKETHALFEEKRARILEALTRLSDRSESGP